MRIAFTDAAGGDVGVRHAERTATSGRGLYFVERLASRWGVEATDPRPGKTVWFELSLTAHTEYAVAGDGS